MSTVLVKYDPQTRALRLVVDGVAVKQPGEIKFLPVGNGQHKLDFTSVTHQAGLGQIAAALNIKHTTASAPKEQLKQEVEDYFD